MKIDLIIPSIDIKNYPFKFSSQKTLNKKLLDNYLKTEFENEINNLISLYKFENIYIGSKNKKYLNNINCTFVTINMFEFINKKVDNNFLYYNFFTSKVLTNTNFVQKWRENIGTSPIITSPNIKSQYLSTNLTGDIKSFANAKKLFNNTLVNNEQISQKFHFTNFWIGLFNIEYVKKIKFNPNAIYHDGSIIDYYYRLFTQNIKIKTDLSCYFYNESFFVKESTLANQNFFEYKNWNLEYLHSNQYKSIYSEQFRDFLLKMQVKDLNIKSTKSILYITTPFHWKNGMTKHVQDLISSTSNTHIYIFETSENPQYDGKFKLRHYYNNILINIEYIYTFSNRHISNSNYSNYNFKFKKILTEKKIGLVHIHIMGLGHSLEIPSICKSENIPVILSVHDLYYLGGEYTPNNIENCFDEDLLYDKYNIKNMVSFKKFWSKQIQQVFDDVSNIIFYTEKYIDIYSKFYTLDKNKIQVIEHGSNYHSRYSLSNKNNKCQKFKLLYFGRIRYEKGLKHLIEYANNINNLEIHIIGTRDDKKLLKEIEKNKNIIFHGPYDNFEELANIIKDLNIHAMIIPATWHEAFNFTLSESYLLGLYPIVYDFGALSSRVKKYKTGTILKNSTPKELEKVITYIQSLSQENWNTILEDVEKVNIPTLSDMKIKYQKLYNQTINKINNDNYINYDLYKTMYSEDSLHFTKTQFDILMKFFWHPKYRYLTNFLSYINKFRSRD